MIIFLVTIIISIAVISPVYAANILAVFPHHSYSHHAVYLPYLQELGKKGHNITVISNYPSEHPNITDISIRGFIPIYNNNRKITDVADTAPLNDIQMSINIVWFFYIHGNINEAMFTVDNVKQLFNGSTTYDLLITEHFNNELFLFFAFKFNIPFILMSSCNMLPWNKHAIGQPYALASRPSTLTNLPPKMNFYNRATNTISNVVQLISYKYLCRIRDERIIEQKFGINIPLDRYILNSSLILVNTHFTMFESIPLIPAVIEVGGIHIRPMKPLPIVSVYLYTVIEICYDNINSFDLYITLIVHLESI